MKALLGILVFLTTLAVFADENKQANATPELILKKIQQYKADPTTKEALDTLSFIVSFAVASDDVAVIVDPKFLPWKLGSLDEDLETRYVGAFVAGNIEYQLIHKDNKNNPQAGVKLLLYTYKKLREKNMIKIDKAFENCIKLVQQDKKCK